jgi:hypothetical protein
MKRKCELAVSQFTTQILINLDSAMCALAIKKAAKAAATNDEER